MVVRGCRVVRQTAQRTTRSLVRQLVSWVPHFMTRERIMFSNPTPSKPRLSPAATMSDATPSSHTPSLHYASILQPAAPPQVVALSLRPSLLQFVSIDSLLLNHENRIFEPVCVFYLSSSVFTFLIEMNFSIKSLFAIWSYHHSDSTITFSLV